MISVEAHLELNAMNTVYWVCFSWDLAKGVPACPPLPASFAIRRAVPEDQEAVSSLVLSAFTLDSGWNPFFHEIRPLLEAALAQIFEESKEPFCLVLTHGERVIGVSGLSADANAPAHLLTGPVVALEYHNRGLASALLAHSLNALRQAGISVVRGATKRGSTSAQFIYPKFGAMPQEPPQEAKI